MRLLCDQMLGTLAKWLRILGYDTFYANAEMTDEDLLCIAKNENRIFITRDKELITKAKKENLTVIEINDLELDLQLKKVSKYIIIDEKSFFSRCTFCNTILDKIEKSNVEGKPNEKFMSRFASDKPSTSKQNSSRSGPCRV